MKLGKKYKVRVLRHPKANFGNGEWFRVDEFATRSEAMGAIELLVADNHDERYRIYRGSMIVHDTK